MNESITPTTNHFSPAASLAALGVKLKHLDLFGPIRTKVQIRQKTVKHTPADKLYDAFISLLAGAHGLVEINSRLRADATLQKAFGRSACAEQSVVQETLDASTPRECWATGASHGCHLSPVPSRLRPRLPSWLPTAGCGHERHAMWTQSGFCHKRLLCRPIPPPGRQLGRVLASTYEEVVVDRLFAGNVQLIKALQPLVEAAEATLELDEAKRAGTIIRVDAGGGSLDDLNWLLSRGYRVLAKEYSGSRVLRLAKTVVEWVQDPVWSERSFGWVSEPPTGYVRPVQRIAVRCRRQDGTFAYGVLICSLSAQQVLTMLGRPSSQAADPLAVLVAYVTFYDQRGGGSKPL
jgi:hypothetical protein